MINIDKNKIISIVHLLDHLAKQILIEMQSTKIVFKSINYKSFNI